MTPRLSGHFTCPIYIWFGFLCAQLTLLGIMRKNCVVKNYNFASEPFWNFNNYIERGLFGDFLKITHHTSVILLRKFVKIIMVVLTMNRYRVLCFCTSTDFHLGFTKMK